VEARKVGVRVVVAAKVMENKDGAEEGDRKVVKGRQSTVHYCSCRWLKSHLPWQPMYAGLVPNPLTIFHGALKWEWILLESFGVDQGAMVVIRLPRAWKTTTTAARPSAVAASVVVPKVFPVHVPGADSVALGYNT
jgi:hypothetical protein